MDRKFSLVFFHFCHLSNNILTLTYEVCPKSDKTAIAACLLQGILTNLLGHSIVSDVSTDAR